MTYYWMHIPTRQIGVGRFEGFHHSIFEAPGMATEARRKALELVNQWNAQQSGVWVYWL